MKKKICLLLVLCFAFLLCACESNTEKELAKIIHSNFIGKQYGYTNTTYEGGYNSDQLPGFMTEVEYLYKFKDENNVDVKKTMHITYNRYSKFKLGHKDETRDVNSFKSTYTISVTRDKVLLKIGDSRKYYVTVNEDNTPVSFVNINPREDNFVYELIP